MGIIQFSPYMWKSIPNHPNIVDVLSAKNFRYLKPKSGKKLAMRNTQSHFFFRAGFSSILMAPI